MNVGLVEHAVDLWRFGAPAVLIVWAVLRLLRRANARVRYWIAIAGFLAVLVIPTVPVERQALSLSTGRRAESPPLHQLVEPIASVLPAIWMIGTLLLLARDVVGHVQLHKKWAPAPESLKQQLDWPREVPLMVGPCAMTIGLFRPKVVLPALPLDVLRRIALHELSHARWRDPLVYAALRTLAAVFWIAPVWPLLRWARREREAAADEFALRGSAGEEGHYVEALLRLSRIAPNQAAAMAASDLEYRARRILAPAPRFSIIAAVALSIGCALLATATPADFAVIEVRPSGGQALLPVQPVRTGKSARPPLEVPPRKKIVAKKNPQLVLPEPALTPVPEVEVIADHRDVHVDVHVHVADDERPPPLVITRGEDQRIRHVIRIRN